MSQTTTRINQVGRVMVPVSDQDNAIAFYTEKLGFEVRADIPFGDGDRWVEVGPAGGDDHDRARHARATSSSPAPTPTSRWTSTTSPATHADLKQAGVDVDDEIIGDGNPVPPMFWLRDQDGNILLIVQSQG